MKLALRSLQSRVARRVFAVFLLCALLPFSGLVLLAYYQVVDFFETRNQNQLRDLAKLFGTDVHEKLSLLAASLQILAATVNATGKLPEYKLLDYMTGGHKDRWSGLFFLEANDGARSVMAAPLVVGEEKLGVLTFYSREPDRFGAPELEFLRGLTDQVAIAIYNSQLFERTQRQAAELKKANQAKDEFLGVMSHELRTPLSVTLGYLRMLQEGFLGTLSEQQSQALGTALKHAGDLHAMIENIMQVTQLETGAVVVEKGFIDLVEFLNDLKSRYGYPLDKAITLSWLYPADLPAINTDRAKLATILQNLFGNAIKFTDRGAVSLSARFVAELGAIELSVTDTGIGIAAESQTVIFELFRQLDGSNTREHEGVGLGLYIVKKLADLIGAKISLESAAGQGATFTVTLPVGNGGASATL